MASAALLKGAELAASMRERISTLIEGLHRRGGRRPVLGTLLVGENPSALAYRSSIVRTFARIGIDHRPMDFPVETPPERFLACLSALNEDPTVTGVLVLMPLPDHLPASLVLEHLSPLKDVDGITPTNAGRLHLGLPSLRPSTPQGGIELLDHYRVNLEGTRAVVIGRSNVVGRPLATLLTLRHATVTVCHRRTRDLAGICREAELLCSAAGAAGYAALEGTLDALWQTPPFDRAE